MPKIDFSQKKNAKEICQRNLPMKFVNEIVDIFQNKNPGNFAFIFLAQMNDFRYSMNWGTSVFNIDSKGTSE